MNTAIVEYGRELRARWRWIVWGILFALAATTVFLIVRPPMYRVDATVFVRTPGDVSSVLDGGDSYAQGRARNYAVLASSSSVAARVIADLGLDLPPEVLSQRISATNPPGTAIIDIAVDATSAEEAQRTAAVLLSEFATTVRTLESVPGSLVPRAEVVVVDPPGPPERVVARGAPLWLVILGATLIGLLAGATAAVFRSIFDDSVRDPRDASRISGRPLIGSVGGEPSRRRTTDDWSIRRNLLRMMGDTTGGAVTVTEPGTGPGITTASTFLASVLAGQDPSVILVDLDLNSAELTQRLSTRELPGVTDVLGADCTVADATLKVAHGWFLGAGRATDSTAELIDSTAMRSLIAELRQHHAFVVLACPAATDAAAIADVSDVVVLAVHKGVTTPEQLRQTSTFLADAATCAVLFDRGGHADPAAESESDMKTKAPH